MLPQGAEHGCLWNYSKKDIHMKALSTLWVSKLSALDLDCTSSLAGIKKRIRKECGPIGIQGNHNDTGPIQILIFPN